MAIVVPILSKYDPRGVREAERQLERFGRSVGDFAKKAAIGIGVAAGAVGALAFSLVKAGEQASTDNARIQQIAESMGLFGENAATVTKRLDDLAKKTALATGIDRTQISQTQAKLLTFEELAKTADVVGGSFDRATKAALDLAAAGFGEATSNATQLGKALQDPVKGITALTRSGVTFTNEQRDLIDELVRTNRIGEAQELVLAAIERQVGGTAEATADASQRMRVAFEQVREEVGLALLPLFERLTDWVINRLIPAFQQWWQVNGPKVVEFLQAAAEWGGEFLGRIYDIAQGLKDWWTEGGKVQEFLGWLADWLVENPEKVADLAVALAAVYASLKLISTMTAVIGFFSAIGSAAGAASGFVSALGTSMTVGFGGAVAGFLGLVGIVVAGFDRLIAGLRTLEDLFGRVIPRIQFGGGFEWRDLIPEGFKPGIGPSRPSGGFLPRFATGGIVTGPTVGLIGEAGPEAVIPLDRLGEMQSGVNITVNGALDPVAVANQINRLLQQRSYRNAVA